MRWSTFCAGWQMDQAIDRPLDEMAARELADFRTGAGANKRPVLTGGFSNRPSWDRILVAVFHSDNCN